MKRQCEVCLSLVLAGDEPEPSGRVRNLLFDERIVVLCDVHAAEVKLEGISSLDQLRAHFREGDGRRSLVSRRGALDRRAFPPRPEGRRRDDGRRVSDPIAAELILAD